MSNFKIGDKVVLINTEGFTPKTHEQIGIKGKVLKIFPGPCWNIQVQWSYKGLTRRNVYNKNNLRRCEQIAEDGLDMGDCVDE